MQQLHSVNTTCGQLDRQFIPTVCRRVHTMQLLHRQLDKLSHVVFTLCDGLSNSFSRLNSRLIIQLCYELRINLNLRPAIRHYRVMMQRRRNRGAAGARATPSLILSLRGAMPPQHWCSAIGCCPYLLVQFSVSGA